MSQRTNEEWLVALRGAGREEALAELRELLLRGLRIALADGASLGAADLEDVVQDALLRVLANLDSFRGESRFTTWAHKIAIHQAFSELRRRRWRDVSLDQVTTMPDSLSWHHLLPDPSAGPEDTTIQTSALDSMRDVITQELTERQRQALVAVYMHGMPPAEVARRMGSNRNALYKLLHDARQRLKKRLLEKGLAPQEVLSAFGLPVGVRGDSSTESAHRKEPA
jgi:RNA polymerase sigma-70 factor (ECF subfamily)